MGLRGLLRLRWVAVIGQIVACIVARLILGIELSVGILAAGILVTAVTNVGVIACRQRLVGESSSRTLCGVLLLLDTMTLTAMLYVTGGLHNPFAAFLLLHLTIAAILLPPFWTWIGVNLCGVASILLYFSPSILRTTSGQLLIGDNPFFLYGNIIGLVLTGGCITYFVTRLSADLRRHEAELERTRAITERGERFAAMATLAAGVAHELATPLGTIAVASAELQYSARENRPGSECLPDANLIRKEVERCRQILEKLNDKATSSLGETPAPVAVRQIPLLLPPYLKTASQGHVTFEVAPEAEPLDLIISQEALLQSLAVLVNNGVDAGVAGGVEPNVFFRIARERDHVVFIVQDEGCGMDPATVRRVGEPFFTTKPPGSGMGLGLFLVRAFADKANGTFRIESVKGQGTTVFLSIPFDL